MQPNAMIAMSGGVDSSVAAFLTLQQGYSCIGATMYLHRGPDPDGQSDAKAVAARLGIPFYSFDCTDMFRQKVMDPFAASYEAGLTPNPCIECNRYLKFGAFLNKALEHHCDCMVTGHYARILCDQTTGRYLLAKAADASKDQSYFLYALTQDQMSRIRFPLGELTKTQVRQIAQEQGFLNAGKRDSQDICFVPDGDYMTFLRSHTGKVYPCGTFLDQNGVPVGTHQGAVAYTLGQRKGLGLAMGAPVYVCAKDMAANTVTVGPGEALFHDTLVAEDWFFFPYPTLTEPLRIHAKTRSRMQEQPATAYPLSDGRVKIVFDTPQRAITPGQAVVLYDGELVIGGGTITQVL